MLNFFDEPYVNNSIFEDNLLSLDPFEGINNNYDTYEDIFPTSLEHTCYYCMERAHNSNNSVNDQENNHTNNNNNQTNIINNNNNNNTNSNSNNNNHINSNNNNSNNNNNTSSNNNTNERIPNSIFSDLSLPQNYRFKPRNREKTKNIKNKLTKTKFIKSLNKDKDCCIICLQEFRNGQNIYKLQCDHIFHIRCLNKEIKYRQKCPMCRKKF